MIFREFREGDEPGLIQCIRDEYGDSYFKQSFYRPEYLRETAGKQIIFLVAQAANDEIAGMLILKNFYPCESMCEIASQIFKRKYRGYGMAMPFFRYGMKILEQGSYSAAYCLPVLFHDVTQRLLYRLGLRAAGFILNVFDVDQIRHSYGNGRNNKHSMGIQAMAVEKRDVGRLYLPEEHRQFCRELYEKLGVSCSMGVKQLAFTPEQTVLEQHQDERQSSLEIRIHQVGRDYRDCISRLEQSYPLKGKQTCNIFLNVNDENAVEVYRYLIGRGFFFTGMKPLCSSREYMVLHHSGEVKIYFTDYRVSKEFGELLLYVENCYEEKKYKEKKHKEKKH